MSTIATFVDARGNIRHPTSEFHQINRPGSMYCYSFHYISSTCLVNLHTLPSLQMINHQRVERAMHQQKHLRHVSPVCLIMRDINLPIDSGPSGSQPPPPQAVAAPYAGQQHVEAGHGQVTTGWSPPPTPQVAKARAIRRFWVSFMWAWLIWIVFGYVH
jgi:hypothetical protein